MILKRHKFAALHSDSDLVRIWLGPSHIVPIQFKFGNSLIKQLLHCRFHPSKAVIRHLSLKPRSYAGCRESVMALFITKTRERDRVFSSLLDARQISL